MYNFKNVCKFVLKTEVIIYVVQHVGIWIDHCAATSHHTLHGAPICLERSLTSFFKCNVFKCNVFNIWLLFLELLGGPILVVCPLNLIMQDQLRQLHTHGISSGMLDVKGSLITFGEDVCILYLIPSVCGVYPVNLYCSVSWFINITLRPKT